MLFPLGNDRPLRRPTLVTPVLVGTNVVVYLVQLVMARADPERYERFLRETWIWGQDFNWWGLVTSAFLHADSHPWHIIGNMLFLWVFGPNIEDRLGRVGFCVFYLLGAAASGGVHALLSDDPAIGASGAVAACTGAFLVLFPRTQVKCIMLLGYVGVVNVPAWWFIVLAIAWDVLLQSSGAQTGVAHAAHLGGTVYGMTVAMVLLWLKVLPREPFDLFTMGRQAIRRRQFKEASVQAAEANKRRWAKSKDEGSTEESDALATARAEVSKLIGKEDLAAAATAYRGLADRFGDRPGATVLSRGPQYHLANWLYGQGRFVDAAYAYDRFLEGYPKDSEAPQVRLILGLIHAREFNDPVRAKALITEAAARLDGDALGVAKRELANLG
jgi:membrane associated rhomboid family serine protease